MNILFWILQILLALHTITGAAWKYTNSEQSIPSLSAIPHGVWIALMVIEYVCGLGLIVSFVKGLAKLAPIAAACIAMEMIFFSVVHLISGNTEHGQMIYWLVVATLAGFIAYGRLFLKPLK